MTPEERLESVLDDLIAYYDRATMRQVITDAIRAAVAAEREACAKVADAENLNDVPLNDAETVAANIAAAIRARADAKPAWEWDQKFPMEEML